MGKQFFEKKSKIITKKMGMKIETRIQKTISLKILYGKFKKKIKNAEFCLKNFEF